MLTPKFYDSKPCVCVKNAYIQNISKIITGTYFYLKKYNIPLDLASVSPFSMQININLCNFKAILKAMYFKTSMVTPYFLCFILISYLEMILYARN